MMLRTLALATCLAAPAAAQTIGLPARMAPCADTHFEADRYRAELEAQGWVFIPAKARAIQVERLVQSFAVLTVDEDTPEADIITEARQIWLDRGEKAMIFEGGDQTLMLSGVAGTPETGHSILCYLSLPGASDLDGAFVSAAARGSLQDTATQTFSTTYADVRPGQTLRATFTRPNPERGETAATAGFATRLDFPVEAVNQ